MDIAYTFLAEAGNLISNMSCWPRPPNNYSIFVQILTQWNITTIHTSMLSFQLTLYSTDLSLPKSRTDLLWPESLWGRQLDRCVVTIVCTSLAVPAEVLPNMALNRDRHTSCWNEITELVILASYSQCTYGTVTTVISSPLMFHARSYFNGVCEYYITYRHISISVPQTLDQSAFQYWPLGTMREITQRTLSQFSQGFQTNLVWRNPVYSKCGTSIKHEMIMRTWRDVNNPNVITNNNYFR